ncbi:hypothetical protein [Phytoactinopolyspora mesophila]|uniref:hypothetical protein n=1 Tax=Phytoactinopolyspora mesophila TaxID=2650750 RepID=UPI001C9E2B24|nr:hypothetical protein [Phytoactinopolyspora mesophila]
MARKRALVTGGAAVAVLLAPVIAVADEPGTDEAAAGQPSSDWRLVQSENFGRMIPSDDTGWFRDKDGPGSPYDVDHYDNDGDYFRTFGGETFDEHLDGIDLYRRSFTLGRDGWLTAELAARDTDGTGVENEAPSFTRSMLRGAGPTGKFDVPTHHGGVILRSTDPLPEEYRIETTLRAIDFGGQRGGEWDYDGLVNGYVPTGCKTFFPWAGGTTWNYDQDECDFHDVTTDSNGFYYLSIMDYDRPAPHNNVFIHTHRKVVMDGYNRYRYTGNGLRYCDPNTGELQPYEWGSGNGVNMLFMIPEKRYANQPGTEYLMHSECGTEVGGGIVSQVDLMPELMPRESYTFAIERRDGAYVLEVTGNFRHVGHRTVRYEQPFDDGENPIWHYNQRADEYDGRYNRDWTYTSPDATFVDEDVWPAGSAYPDYFLIGQPHMNYYEGSAHIDNVRLYVPR